LAIEARWGFDQRFREAGWYPVCDHAAAGVIERDRSISHVFAQFPAQELCHLLKYLKAAACNLMDICGHFPPLLQHWDFVIGLHLEALTPASNDVNSKSIYKENYGCREDSDQVAQSVCRWSCSAIAGRCW
jgi:hypothetical protein